MRGLLSTTAALTVAVAMTACAGPQTAGQETSWSGAEISGRVLDTNGNPVENAHVYAYGPDRPNTLGPADAMSEPSDGNGQYLLILPPGHYTLVARWRQSGSISGPLRPGDLSGRYSEPVDVSSGPAGPLDLVVRPFAQGSGGDPKRVLSTTTRLEGRVVNDAGRPVAGAYAFAFRGPFRQSMPDYLSTPTGSDGVFELSLPGGGQYTVGARTGSKGKPSPGDLFGFWIGNGEPGAFTGGTVTNGVTIVIRPWGSDQ